MPRNRRPSVELWRDRRGSIRASCRNDHGLRRSRMQLDQENSTRHTKGAAPSAVEQARDGLAKKQDLAEVPKMTGARMASGKSATRVSPHAPL
jgi:hypothetical protein